MAGVLTAPLICALGYRIVLVPGLKSERARYCIILYKQICDQCCFCMYYSKAFIIIVYILL